MFNKIDINKKNLLNELNKKGYCLINDVLKKKSCDKLKKILEDNYQKYNKFYASNKTKHKLNYHKNEKLIFNLHNKNELFLKFICPNPIFEVVEQFLKQGFYKGSNSTEPIILKQMTGRTPLKEGKEQKIHIDTRSPGSKFPLLAIIIYCIDESLKSNSTTRIIPGSHKKNSYPPDNDNKIKNKIKEINLKKGSALIINGSLWHGGGANRDINSSWRILATYTPWFYKQSFDLNKNLPLKYYKKLSFKQKVVLGYTSLPPLDEFTRILSKSKIPEFTSKNYKLIHGK